MSRRAPKQTAAGPADPVAAATRFLRLVASGRVEDAWPLADPEWRLAVAQVWLWGHRRLPAYRRLDLEQEARASVDGLGRRWCRAFIQIQQDTWRDVLGGCEIDPRRATTCPVSVDYEQVDIAGQAVLVHLVAGRWLVAAVDGPRYQPGWPPTFQDGTPAV